MRPSKSRERHVNGTPVATAARAHGDIARRPAQRRLIRLTDVLERVPVSRTTLWRWMRAGLFPKRVQIGPNTVGWWEDEIDDWLKSRQAEQ